MDLPGVFGTVAPFLEDYGYAAVALFVLLENFGVIVPGEAVLVTAALFAGAGRLDLKIVVVVAFIAAVTGDNLGYLLGSRGGRPLVLRLGRRIGVTDARLGRVEGFFLRHGVKLVLVARFLPVLRHGNGIAAGTTLMPWRRFLWANAIGAAMWTAVWTTLGYRGAGHIDAIDTGLRRSGQGAFALLALAVVVLVLRHRRHRSRERESANKPDPLHIAAPAPSARRNTSL